MENYYTTYATLSNGNETQIKVYGDQKAILNFVVDYEGSDLGNDLICEDFVEDFEETGVVIGNN